jgi:membrane protease YdiL (CAAX protease family)
MDLALAPIRARARTLAIRVRVRRRGVALAAGILTVVAARMIFGSAPAAHAAVWRIAGSVAVGVVEEALFRGALYRLLFRRNALTAIVGSAVAFALVHVIAYGIASIPVNLAAGLLFGWQRQRSGGWGVPAVTHALADVLALI